MIALRLSKEGYGSVEEILSMRADLALAAMEFVTFAADYEETAIELNKGSQ